MCMSFFFFNDTATTEIYTLSLHDALPIYFRRRRACADSRGGASLRNRSSRGAAGAVLQSRSDRGSKSERRRHREYFRGGDRKSTRLNSSHQIISYAVFCFKKKT